MFLFTRANISKLLILLHLAAFVTTAQWKQLPIPSACGRIGIDAHGVVFILTDGTLCISDPGKDRWTYQVFPFDINGENNGYIYGSAPKDLLPASDDTLIFLTDYNKIFYIVKGEESIHSSTTGLKSQSQLGWPFLIKNRGKDGEILLCHYDLYQTTNCGQTWEMQYEHPDSVSGFYLGAVEIGNSDVLYVRGNSYIYKSTDNAASWELKFKPRDYFVQEDMLAAPDGQVYAGKYHSKDSGNTWAEYSMEPWAVASPGANMRYIYNGKEKGIFVLNYGNGLFFKTLADDTFTETTLSSATFPENPRRGCDLACDSSSGEVYVIVNDSLYEYNRGAPSQMTNRLYTAATTAFESYNDDGDTLLFCTPHTIMKSPDRGNSWSSFPVVAGAIDRLTISETTKNLYYTYNSSLPFQINVYENDTLADISIFDKTRFRLTYDPFRPGTFYGGDVWLWRLTDSIVTHWPPHASVFLEAELVANIDLTAMYHLRCLAFDPHKQGVMYLGGIYEQGNPFLLQSRDLGKNWEKITSIPLRQAPIEIMPDPKTLGKIVVVDPSGVYITTDAGTSWTTVDPGIGVRMVTCAVMDPVAPQNIFLGVASPCTNPIPQSRDEGGGVWQSSDGGYTWKKLPIEGLFNYNISQLKIYQHPRRVLVGTPCGAYEYLLDSTSTGVRLEGANPETALKQNYPNPYGEKTTIEYMLRQSSDVRIVVTDVLGRIVASTVQTNMNPGSHRYDFDGRTLTNGVYRYNVETRSGVQSRWMIVAH